MSKSLIYTANTTSTAVAIGEAVPFGSIIRRYGNINLIGSAINLTESGYYMVDMSAVFSAAATGTVTISLYQDGVQVGGATVSKTIATANTEIVEVAMSPIVRVRCCGNSSLSFVVSGNAPTIRNFDVRVIRI